MRLLAVESDEAASYGVEQRLTVNARAAGPRLGKDVQIAIKGSKSGDWSVAEDGTVTTGGLALEEGEYTLETVAGSADAGTATGVLRSGGFVVLDTEVTPELAAEGLARDLVRAVQQARRDAGLDVSDRIALTIGGSAEVPPRPAPTRELITTETLATSYDVVAADGTEPPSRSPRPRALADVIRAGRWSSRARTTSGQLSATGCGRPGRPAAGTPRSARPARRRRRARRARPARRR